MGFRYRLSISDDWKVYLIGISNQEPANGIQVPIINIMTKIRTFQQNAFGMRFENDRRDNYNTGISSSTIKLGRSYIEDNEICTIYYCAHTKVSQYVLG